MAMAQLCYKFSDSLRTRKNKLENLPSRNCCNQIKRKCCLPCSTYLSKQTPSAAIWRIKCEYRLLSRMDFSNKCSHKIHNFVCLLFRRSLKKESSVCPNKFLSTWLSVSARSSTNAWLKKSKFSF